MTDRWYGLGFSICLPRTTSLRGTIFAFVMLLIVVINLSWSPRITPTSPLPSEIEYVPTNQVQSFPQAGYSGDFIRLIDITSFDFVLNHFPCNKSGSDVQALSPMMLLIFVHSNPANFAKRQVIRDTWGSWANTPRTDITINLIFLLGKVLNNSLQNQIDLENKIRNDIVQGNFLDSYRNLTYKHVMGLKWCTYFCPQASYVLKTDDDIFVNMPALVRFLTLPHLDYSIKPAADRFIFCNRIDNAHVKRSYRSKWHVSPSEFSSKYYPSYCMGCAILYSFDVVTQLYKKAQISPYFWVDDVHITGILAKQLNLTVTHLGDLMLKQTEIDSIISNSLTEDRNSWFLFWKRDVSRGYDDHKFLYGTELESDDVRKLWKIISNQSDTA